MKKYHGHPSNSERYYVHNVADVQLFLIHQHTFVLLDLNQALYARVDAVWPHEHYDSYI